MEKSGTNDAPQQRQKEIAFPVIKHEVGNELINQRAKDGYINATAMCKAAGKRWNNYLNTTPTKDFVDVLSSETGIPVSELIQSIRGGNPDFQGTWVHPRVAINLAQWLSPQFAVQVTEWVFDWLSGVARTDASLPYHLRRYMENMARIPPDHFSILQELTHALIAPMEARGYSLPANMIPDISEGRMFARWLRNEHGIDPSQYPKYMHVYEDGRVVEARLYPNHLLAAFRQHYAEVWLPTRSRTYFAERDQEALPYLEEVIALITYIEEEGGD